MQLNNETINGLVSALNLKCALCELYASCFSIRRVIIYIYIYILFAILLLSPRNNDKSTLPIQ